MDLQSAQKELSLKIVYTGAPLSGKTTNLQALHQIFENRGCGKLVTLETHNDRTLFFDLLPFSVLLPSGYRVKLKVYTVPGQVMHASTRRLVLASTDGVIFVADSQRSETTHNTGAWRAMRQHLRENGLEPNQVPTVIQFNKRDLPEIRSEEEIKKLYPTAQSVIFKAIAIRGEGVFETFYGLLEILLSRIEQRYQLQERFALRGMDILEAVKAAHNLWIEPTHEP